MHFILGKCNMISYGHFKNFHYFFPLCISNLYMSHVGVHVMVLACSCSNYNIAPRGVVSRQCPFLCEPFALASSIQEMISVCSGITS